ncbi:MAG: hypothetical protein JSV89_17765 [Spirochaetaceae bacterium]|nr:MAG: hypothetical protein JSV89_17765 [Spirochaetaceae bacterium]
MNNRKPSFVSIVVSVLLVAAGTLTAQGQFEDSQRSRPWAAEQLPLAKVVLFTSGVGYFQREGAVSGNTDLDLYFKTKDINDLLKSLVVQDLDGGQITEVTYSSRDPLTRTLQSFAIDLTGNPGVAQILAQARGEKVELTTSQRITGTVVGVESKASGEHTTDTFLNLLAEGALRSINLAEVRALSFLNPQLQAELDQALSLLAESRSAEKKRVTVGFAGQGSRRVRVGYLLEAPLWKTSYRLVLGEENEHFLQGWAIVENTTDEDWRDVSLSLISGRPISFIMDLYRPLYVPRPTVEVEMYSSIAPQRYEEDLELAAAPEAPMAKGGIAESRAAPMAEQMYEEEYRRDELDLSEGVTTAARAEEAGSFFRYLIRHPVTVPRQESAMLPIVTQNVEGRRFSIYNQRVQAKHPLHGLKLKNTTGFDLMGGPLTVFEQGNYAGDARIDTLPAGAERLISFAIDLDTEVAVSSRSIPETLISVRIVKGTLISTVSLRAESTYTIKNSDDRSRSVLIEHPLSPDWELITPAKAEETTRSAYRFLVEVPAGKTEELLVARERQIDRTVVLTNINDSQITYFLSARNVDRRIKQALEGLAERKSALAQTVNQRQEQERRINTIHREQGRIRENMARLEKTSDLYKRYVSLLDEQEDQLEQALSAIESLRAKEQQQREELDRYILSIDLP